MKQKYEKEESDSFEEDMEERMRDIRKATISPFYADGTPFDGVFYVDGDDEPLAIDLKTITMGDLERLMEEKEDKNTMTEKLLEWIGELTDGDRDLSVTLMKKAIKRLTNKTKLKTLCRIIVQEDGLYVERPDDTLEKVIFGRGNLSKTLYIFFLRQIMRNEKDNSIPSCLSQFELKDYKDELIKIYENISGKQGDVTDVESWLETGTTSNTYANATASIRRYFDKEFDNYVINYKWKKCYSIEIMGEDRYGNPRYGIKLDPKDFVLKWPFEV